ncbi:MAG: hypothetical protein IKO36_00840 [Bacteroidaceae bacterium]|nr:hypothetical protein [Bacteroidaceae bacterium]
MKNPITLDVNCTQCGKTVNLVVEYDDLMRWYDREDNIQNIFPYLSAGEREMLNTGICSDCWDKLFK